VLNWTIVICALCVASAIFLMDDFDSPFDGLLHVSSEAMRDTLSHIDAPFDGTWRAWLAPARGADGWSERRRVARASALVCEALKANRDDAL
jgi:hypothetical protein